MNKFIALAFILVCCGILTKAQDAALLSNPQDISLRSQAGFTFTRIDQSPGILLNYGIGLILKNQLFVGLGGEVLINSLLVPDAQYVPVRTELAYWKMNYQGLKLGYQFPSSSAWQLTVGMLAGAGKVERGFICNGLSPSSPEYAGFDQRLKNPGYVYVLQPSLGMNARLTKRMAVKLDVSYRFLDLVHASDTPGITAAKFSSPSFGITFQF